MAGISIPGVSDKYKTNDLIASLIEVERLPLKREQEAVETYKTQQEAWRGLNQRFNTLRESARFLFSFENPFNTRTASSSNEGAVSAATSRNADLQSFKIDVVSIAKADRFLSAALEKNAEAPRGIYTYSVADKSVTLDWKGGKVTDFVAALNKRGNGLVKASLIGVTKDKQSVLIESFKTGAENRLNFAGDARDFAVNTGMIAPGEVQGPQAFGKDQTAQPQSDFSVDIPVSESGIPRILEFTLQEREVEDVTIALNEKATAEAQKIQDAAIAARNAALAARDEAVRKQGEAQERAEEPQIVLGQPAETEPLIDPDSIVIPEVPELDVKLLEPALSEQFVWVRDSAGNETPVDTAALTADAGGKKTVTLNPEQYPDVAAIIVRNGNTGKEAELSAITVRPALTPPDFTPLHPVEIASDAALKYEGVAIERPSNSIDDIVPG
ncbi:MAG: flagellar hook protein, partial [Treponema sp.]|nr:flagellar hook protein [Treponema sp.]